MEKLFPRIALSCLFLAPFIDTFSWAGEHSHRNWLPAPATDADYFDNNHLTNTGAIAIRDSYAPVFAPTEQGVD